MCLNFLIFIRGVTSLYPPAHGFLYLVRAFFPPVLANQAHPKEMCPSIPPALMYFSPVVGARSTRGYATPVPGFVSPFVLAATKFLPGFIPGCPNMDHLRLCQSRHSYLAQTSQLRTIKIFPRFISQGIYTHFLSSDPVRFA